jgi:hypothetical protein
MSNNITKHVNTKYHFVRKLIEKGTVSIEYVESENQQKIHEIGY